ncbi:hypothetical protein [Bradyrhizobium sp. USDA 3364]
MRVGGPHIPRLSSEPSEDSKKDRLVRRAQAERFYREILAELLDAKLPFLVGGGYAVNTYTGARIPTKDLDIFTTRAELQRLLAHLNRGGRRVSIADDQWLGKIHYGEYFVDVIFGSSNGIVPVQEGWFHHAREAQVLGLGVLVIDPTELIWSKAFIQKRFRHDGSDIANIILKQSSQIDWQRLMVYFDAHWEVLLSHLLIFRWIYPSERNAIPSWLLDELLERLNRQRELPPTAARMCRGRLLSRSDYQSAVEVWGFLDAKGKCDDD